MCDDCNYNFEDRLKASKKGHHPSGVIEVTAADNCERNKHQRQDAENGPNPG
jgi:hypothetical protein